jgi:hypothetical protein
MYGIFMIIPVTLISSIFAVPAAASVLVVPQCVDVINPANINRRIDFHKLLGKANISHNSRSPVVCNGRHSST